MNKKLLVIAVGAAMVAGTSVAMADSSVYGKINAGIVSYDDGDDEPNDASGIGVFDEASRLGAKGSADLGNGMKAIFKMEGTFDLDGDSGGGTAFMTNRDSYVGLKGGFGQVIVGYKNTSFKNATGKMDLFGDMWGDMTGSGFGSFDRRENNMVQYSGKFGMVGVSADVNFAEATDAGNDEDKMGLSVGVIVKPMKGLMVSVATASRGGGTAVNDSATKLGAQWKGGPHTVNFVYKTETDDSAAADENQTVMYVQYGIGFGGGMSVQAAYQMLTEDADDRDANQISVAFVKKMSKATKVYVAFSSVANDDLVSHDGRLDSGLGHLDNTDGGSTASGLAVGVTHKF